MPEPERVEIVRVSASQIPAVRELWREYWEALALPPDFQSFAEESSTLPGVYAPPGGRLLLAFLQGKPVGTVALRPLSNYSCEAKRLYVRPLYRGKGIARALLNRLVQEARGAGYQEMFGDTLKSMTAALTMYRQIGFVEVAPYSSHPTPEAVFLKLRLPN